MNKDDTGQNEETTWLELSRLDSYNANVNLTMNLTEVDAIEVMTSEVKPQESPCHNVDQQPFPSFFPSSYTSSRKTRQDMSGDPGDPGPSTHVKRESDTYQYLDSLNEAQYKGQLPTAIFAVIYKLNLCPAVTAPPEIPLQILAGPGSGKTRVLTSRVAHLVRKHGYRPMEITAVTFTNKAANEMKKRLAVLLGPKDADALILGMLKLEM